MLADKDYWDREPFAREAMGQRGPGSAPVTNHQRTAYSHGPSR